jgi:hypothetical protein
MTTEKMFPIQADHTGPATSVPWWIAEVAYQDYARRFGRDQSLERLAERGGFGRWELIDHIRASEGLPKEAQR